MANDVVVKIGGDTSEFQNSLAGLGKTLIDSIGALDPVVAGLVGTITAIGTTAVESGENFETAYNTIIAKTGETGDSLDDLKTSFDDVFTSVPAQAQDVADALSLIHDRLGLTGTAATDLTTDFIQLANFTGQQVNPLVDSGTKLFNNWSIATGDQSTALNTLFSISQQTGTSFQTLVDAMTQGGTAARLAGLDFDTFAGQVATLQKNGIDASDVMQGMSRAMATAQKAGIDLSDVTLNNLVGSVQKAIDAGNGLNVAIDLFGSRTGPKMYQLISDGKVTLDSLNTSFNTNKNAIGDTAATVETFGQKLTVLKNNLEALFAPIGEFVIGAGKDFLDWMNKAVVGVNAIVDYISGNTTALKNLTDQYDKTNPAVKAFSDGMDTTATSNMNKEVGALGISYNGLALGTQTATKGTVDLVAAEQQAQAVKEALKKVTEDLAKADSDHAEYIKSTYVPAITDVQTAEQNLADARVAYIAADQAEQTLRIQLTTATGQAVITTEAAIATASANSKAAREALSEAEKSLQASRTTSAALTRDIQSAEDALSAADRATHIPAIVDHQTALENIATAQANYETAVTGVQTAEAALQIIQDSSTKSAQDVKAAEDDLTTAKNNLKAATTALTQANSDEKASLALLSSAQKEIDDDDKANLESKKLLGTGIADLDDSLAAYQTSLGNAKTAADNLADAEANLKTVRDSGTASEQQLKDAIDAAKTARENATLADKDANTNLQVLTTQYGLSKDAVLLLNQHMTDATTDSQTLQAAYKDLGIQSTQSLDALATAAQQAFTDIKNSGTTSQQQLQTAWMNQYTTEEAAATAHGVAMSASDQLMYAKLKTDQSDFATDQATSWSTLYTSIDKDVQGTAASMINTLFTGSGSFHDEAIKGLEEIGEAVVTKFTKPFTDAVASLISGAITDLLSGKGLGGVLDDVTKIGSGLTNINFGGLGGGGGIGAPGTGTIGETVGTGDTLAGLGSAGGGGASSGLTSGLGSLTGIFSGITAVSSAVSAITGILTMFGVGNSGDQLDRLNGIDNATTRLAQIFDVQLLPWFGDWYEKSLYFYQYQFDGWFHDRFCMPVADDLDGINQRSVTTDYNINAMAQNIALLLKTPPVVNVYNTLDAKGFATTIETQIAADLKGALT